MSRYFSWKSKLSDFQHLYVFYVLFKKITHRCIVFIQSPNCFGIGFVYGIIYLLMLDIILFKFYSFLCFFLFVNLTKACALQAKEARVSSHNRKQEILNNKKLCQLQGDCLKPRGNVEKNIKSTQQLLERKLEKAWAVVPATHVRVGQCMTF